tara:strand:+ start:348 stop:788 length:441 start_codon:yes stop_codon:yes gene_type:complete
MGLAITFGFIAAVGFGLSAVFARLGLQRIAPKLGTFVSLLTGFLFTLVIVLMLHSYHIRSLTPVVILWCILFSFVTFPLARLLNYYAIKLSGTSRSTPVVALSPLFATMIAMVAVGETPNFIIGLGILVTVLGMMLLLSDRRSGAT